MNMINPEVFNNVGYLKEGLESPFLIVPNALMPDCAEQLYEELMSAYGWNHEAISTTSGFVYERDAIPMETAPAQSRLGEMFRFLSGQECLAWMTNVSGRVCDDFQGSAAIFRPGNQITEHSDHQVIVRPNGRKAVRAVTFNYYLAKNWDARLGGRFVWKTPREYIVPSFNTLVLFKVGSHSKHWVEPIAEGVTHTRLSVTGWFLTTLDNPESPQKRKLNIKI